MGAKGLECAQGPPTLSPLGVCRSTYNIAPKGVPANFKGVPANFRGVPAKFKGVPANFTGVPTKYRGCAY